MPKNDKKNQHRWAQDNKGAAHENNDRVDRLELEGQVIDALPGTLFKVLVDGGAEVLCALAGKIRQNRIRILPGDQVKIEVSPYDLSRGRIVWRR